MTRKPLTPLTVRIAMALVALMGVALLGAYALQAHQMQREIADLPLVRLDPVVVIAERAQSATVGSAQVAKNPVASTVR